MTAFLREGFENRLAAAEEENRTLRVLLARAANVIESGGSNVEGVCSACEKAPHAPDCIVREIRASLGEPQDYRSGWIGDDPTEAVADPPGGPWANMQAGEVQRLKPEEVGLPPGPGERPPKRPLPPLLSDRETSLYAAVLDLTARINSAAVNRQIPVAVKVPILRDLLDAWHRARPVSCVVDWPELGRTKAPPETFAVIRYVGDDPWVLAMGDRYGACIAVLEGYYDQAGPETACQWEIKARGISSHETAQAIAQALSSRPFSE